MGQTWREMDPKGAAKQDQFLGRLLKLRRRIERASLAGFKGSDFPALYRVMNCGAQHQANDADLTQLENRLRPRRR